MATVTHATVVAVADDGTSPVGSDEWNADHVVTGVRELLTADRTYYVRTDGSDSNDGLANTAGGAFLTIQKAADVVAGAIDFGGKNVNISVGAGTFVGATFNATTGGGFLTLTGAGSGSTTITPSGGNSLYIFVNNFGFNAVTIAVNGYGIYIDNQIKVYVGSFLVTTDLVFDGTSGYAIGLYAPCNVYIGGGDIEVSGSFASFYDMAAQGMLTDFGTWTATGTPTWSTAFINAYAGSVYLSGGATYTGAATGKRFISSGNASINTSGGGANFFPGDVAGDGTDSGTSPYGLYQ
jgi:hypothetical protein